MSRTVADILLARKRGAVHPDEFMGPASGYYNGFRIFIGGRDGREVWEVKGGRFRRLRWVRVA